MLQLERLATSSIREKTTASDLRDSAWRERATIGYLLIDENVHPLGASSLVYQLPSERAGCVSVVTAIFREEKSLQIREGSYQVRLSCFLRPDRASACEVRNHKIPGTDSEPDLRAAILASHAGIAFLASLESRGLR